MKPFYFLADHMNAYYFVCGGVIAGWIAFSLWREGFSWSRLTMFAVLVSAGVAVAYVSTRLFDFLFQ
jgi:hypothetical protein